MALVPAFVFVLFEDHERRNFMRLHKRHLRDVYNPFEMPDAQFIMMFRLSKEIVHYIIERLTPHINQRRRTSGLPLHMKVFVTLNFLSRGSYQYGVGNSSWTPVSQPTVSRCVSQICQLIAEVMMPEWIQFPITFEEQSRVKQGFYNAYGFRGVIGAIDGTHVSIVAPFVTDEEHPPHVYINRKGYHSINVMLISDSNNRILSCDARYPGSVHDSAIYRMHDVRNYLVNNYENGDRASHLIGDSGYPLEPWLFTPFQVVQDGTPEAHFNNLLKSARNVIERTNGFVKGRFRCLLRHRVLHYHPVKAAYIIYAACVLHNMAIEANLDLDEDDIEDEGNDVNEIFNNNHYLHLGRNARQDFIQRNF